MLKIDKKNLVPAKKLEVKTEIFKVKMGIQPAKILETDTDYSGLLVTNKPDGKVFSIFPGNIFMYIPNAETFNNLFRDWNRIIGLNLSGSEIIMNLSNGAVLASGNIDNKVYLISNNEKRWIQSSAIMDKYYFSWNNIYVIPQVIIDSIPNGNDLI
jgi:hypothetical protein